MKRKTALWILLSIISTITVYGFLGLAVLYILAGGGDLTGWPKVIFAHRDTFYMGNGQPDESRFPLYKPYELRQYSGRQGWFIRLQNDHQQSESDPLNFYISIGYVEKIAVADGKILVYTPDTDPPYEQTHSAVIIPNEKIEIGFKKETDFRAYIHRLNMDEPHWEIPDDLYASFSKTGCLDWIPDCMPH